MGVAASAAKLGWDSFEPIKRLVVLVSGAESEAVSSRKATVG